jgi:Putative Flp pilus-assembly TadE/G-like
VVVAFALVGLLGAAALAVDVGSNDGAQRHLQQVAEAAAMAAASALPSNGDTGTGGTCGSVPTDPAGVAACDSITTNLTGTNLSNVSVTWTPDFRSDAHQIQVAVTANNPAIFAGVFGINSTTITQRAAATNNAPGGSRAALYANDSTCGSTRGIYTNPPANSIDITGAVESAGSLTLNSGGHTSIEGGTYGGPNNCSYSGNVSFTGSNEPVNSTTAKTWPATWASPLACDFSGVSFNLSSSSTPGIYCATGTITVGNNTSGHFTLQAASFSFGQHDTLSPAPDAPGANEESSLKLLIWQTGSGTFDDGNNSTFTGGFWIPNATANINGNSGITGFLEANDIEISGNSFSMTGTGPLLPGGGVTIGITE